MVDSTRAAGSAGSGDENSPTGNIEIRSPALLRALMTSPVEVAKLIQELHRRVHDEASLLDLMARTSREAVRLIVDANWAGVTAQLDVQPFTAAHTDERVLIVDEGQYGQGDGPCLTAFRTDTSVSMTAEEVRRLWPQLAEVADRVGVGAFHAEPLHAHDSTVGSLNLYSTRTAGLRVPDPDVLTVLVEYLDRGLEAYATLQPVEERAWRLKRALVAREVIERAVGVLMELYDIDDERARAVMTNEAKRRHIAAEVVAAETIAHHTVS
jgi:ANTAR domain